MIGNSPKTYATELEGFTTMLANYPIQANIAALQMTINTHGTITIDVCLEPGHLAQGAAELIEWRRTLAKPQAMIERSPNGHTANIAILGHNPENDTLINVWLCTVPYSPQLRTLLAAEGIHPKPDTRQLFNTDLLQLWAIDI
ncbi:hypothetical protein [Actinophytocola sediminis]